MGIVEWLLVVIGGVACGFGLLAVFAAIVVTGCVIFSDTIKVIQIAYEEITSRCKKVDDTWENSTDSNT